MSKDNVESWDATAANNTDISGINIAENCPALGINDAIRAIMAQIKAAFATAAQVLAATASYLFVSPKSLFDAAAWFPLIDAASIAVDQNSGINFSVTLGGNRAMANMSNVKVGSAGFFAITQGSGGSKTLTWGSNYKWPAGAAPTLSTAAGTIDLVSYVVISSTVIRCAIVKGYLA